MNVPRILAFVLPVLLVLAAFTALIFTDVNITQTKITKTIAHDRMQYAKNGS